MKNLGIFLTTGILPVLILFSCQKEDTDPNDEFRIEFNSGRILSERDMLFYDMSSKLFYLKNDLELDSNFSDFFVWVGSDTIYSGIIYPSILSAPPPSPYFISDYSLYGDDILEIGYFGISNDLRNDPRIFDALENSNLLRKGLSCFIDKVEVASFENYSRVICTITVQNNDPFNYYILGPNKMGDLRFTHFTGGVSLTNSDTKLTYFLRYSVPTGTRSDLNMDDFWVLKKDSKVTFVFQSEDYYKIEPGNYSASFSFCGPEHFTRDLNLKQKNGRIWVGRIRAHSDDVTVE